MVQKDLSLLKLTFEKFPVMTGIPPAGILTPTAFPNKFHSNKESTDVFTSMKWVPTLFSSIWFPHLGVLPQIEDQNAASIPSEFPMAPQIEFAETVTPDSVVTKCSPLIGNQPVK